MKKLLLGAFLGVFALAGITILPNYVNAEDTETPPATEEDTDFWAKPKSNTNMVGDGDQTLTGSSLLDTIRNAINWILGILATIALVICLYGGFKMVTAAGDEKKYGEGLKVLKYAAIGLVIVGLSWMIVSVIFWFIGTLGSGNQTQKGTLDTSSNAGNLDEGGSGGDGTTAD